jgi:hypothetical protein
MHAPQTRRGVLATSFGALLPRLITSIAATAALKAMLSRGDDRVRQPQLYSINMTMPTWT